MFFLIELILTLFAWKNGWKWKALLPICVYLLIGFFIEISTGLSNIDANIPFFLNLITIGILVFMSAKKPKNSTENTKHIQNE
jgi:uncharacterized membrane protein YfcA